ncbi:MAG: AzlD domain-containing protein [Tissierellaceae bacterium]|nr:AzlD domain-containing protein [Tissierellaceae bacterium]
MKSYLFLIIGMAAVTYIPRLIPLVALKDRNISKNVEEFLKLIPYTSLSILIVRGIMTADSHMTVATIVGIGVAGLISYIKGNLVLSVLAGILFSFIIVNIAP